ncbi:MAG: type II secretion system protein N [Pseudomonadota bacterium]
MYPRRLLIAAGVAAFLAGLLVLAPLGQWLRLAPPAVAQRISAPTGTLWQGSAQIATSGGPLQVGWDLHPWRLLLATLQADWTLAGSGLSARGTASAAPWGYGVQVDRGELAGERISGVSGGRAVADQPLQFQDIGLGLAPDGRIEEASGRLAWGPGTVRLSDRPEPLALPALRGYLREADGRLKVQVDGENEPGAPLATLTLDPVGNLLQLVVTHRAARLAGVAPAAPAAPDAAFLELSQPLR